MCASGSRLSTMMETRASFHPMSTRCVPSAKCQCTDMTIPNWLLTVLLMAQGAWGQPAPLEKITINYATRTGTTWPLYIAKEAGYFQKCGLDATMVFGVHPAGIAMIVSGEAQMTNYR